MLRLPEKNIPFAIECFVESNLSKVDPSNFHFVPLLEFTFKGSKLKKGMTSLSKELQIKVLEKAKQLIENAKKLMATNGRLLMARSGITIDCHKGQIIVYTEDTIAEAFSKTNFNLVRALFIDYKGHVAPKKVKDALLSVTFEKREK